MKHALPLLAILALAGCATARNVRDYSTMLLYAAGHKVLVFVPVPCAQIVRTKPAIVSGWVREKNLNKLLVVCDRDCNCRLTIRR